MNAMNEMTAESPGSAGSFSARARMTAAYAVYMFAAWPVHLGVFVTVVVLCVAGAATTIVWVGFALLVGGVMVARLAAVAQRRVDAAFTGRSAPANAYADSQAPAGSSPVRRFLQPLRDGQSWLDVAWVAVAFPISTLLWCLALVWVVGALAGLLSPILELADGLVDGDYFRNVPIGELLDLPYPGVVDAVVGFVVGVVFLVTMPFVFGRAMDAQLACGEFFLSRRARIRADVARLTESRAAARHAESRALRQLERDLHDGPQQRLVRLSMDLARARRQAETDSAKTREILDDAMDQTRETLAELRQLSRGIAPPVLVDRGLDAAIAEVAGRSGVPATVRGGLPELPEHVATAAYFVVAEALANVNKHARARSVEVTAEVQRGSLRLTVVDDGVGGADTSKGHGLAGLEERLKSVDGTLEIVSPTGGPTSIRAVIPCGS